MALWHLIARAELTKTAASSTSTGTSIKAKQLRIKHRKSAIEMVRSTIKYCLSRWIRSFAVQKLSVKSVSIKQEERNLKSLQVQLALLAYQTMATEFQFIAVSGTIGKRRTSWLGHTMSQKTQLSCCSWTQLVKEFRRYSSLMTMMTMARASTTSRTWEGKTSLKLTKAMLNQSWCLLDLKPLCTRKKLGEVLEKLFMALANFSKQQPTIGRSKTI